MKCELRSSASFTPDCFSFLLSCRTHFTLNKIICFSDRKNSNGSQVDEVELKKQFTLFLCLQIEGMLNILKISNMMSQHSQGHLFPDNQSSVPSNHVVWLTPDCNSNSTGYPLLESVGTLVHMNIYTETHKK